MRLSNRGTVDRSTLIRFTFDGKPITAFAGDTIASALLAEGRRMIARSFKYHRPRGLVTAGPDDPSGLVTLGRGAARQPNVRAAQQEVYPGLEVFSQNAWPSLDWDLLSLNDRLSPLLGAGFYYKTFMWPAAFWEKLYEPLIRRAAGLGPLPGTPATEPQDRAFAFCDLLIIGGGPAGLRAALVAGRAGADVILADEDSSFGGRLTSETEEIDGAPAPDWLAATLAELAALPNVRLWSRTTVTGAYDGGSFAALERVNRHRNAAPGAPQDCFWRIRARHSLLCTGARERLIAFPGNDRPGVMSAAAVRSYLHRYGAIAGPRVAVFGNNDDAHRTARDLSAAGVQVTALIDTRSGIQPDLGPLRAPFPVLTGAEVFDTEGRHGLHTIRVRHNGLMDAIEADCLAVSGGWNPDIGLATHLGAKPVWDAGLSAFLPPTPDAPLAVPGMIAAGAAAGAFTTGAAFASADRAARRVLEALGRSAPDLPLPRTEDQSTAISPFWQVEAPGRAFLDLQNDVTTKDIALAAREGFTEAEHMKRYTTQGMAPDQGKTSNLVASGVLASLTGRDIAATGVTSWRPPQVPVPVNAMGAGGYGPGFAPALRLPSHEAAAGHGAVMQESGLWYRAGWFPKPGEAGWQEACLREAGYVRGSVGICDVSSLGKFDIQGPDAAAFLDLICTGRLSALPPGRCRYVALLREDGFMLDDGTVARLSPTQFILTSTTAAAEQVAAHLSFVRQVLMPEAKVSVTDVSGHWAQFSLAGPRMTELLDLLLDAPLPQSDLPHMSCLTDRIGGVPARLFRLSFSGERACEVALPARYSAAFWRLALAQAESLGGGAYGTEALNVLRIEKGYITHSEIDGRVTLDDLGLGRMLGGKDCIGKDMSQRPGLTAPGRPQLVGLRPAASPAADLPAHSARSRPQGHDLSDGTAQKTTGRPAALARAAQTLDKAAEQTGRLARHGADTLRQLAGKPAPGHSAAQGSAGAPSAPDLLHGFSSGAVLLSTADPEALTPEGRITSSCWSPALGRVHALALLKDGRSRIGETLLVVDHLRGTRSFAEVCAPCAFDPSGERLT